MTGPLVELVPFETPIPERLVWTRDLAVSSERVQPAIVEAISPDGRYRMSPQYRFPPPGSRKGALDAPRLYVSGDWEVDCARREVRARGTAVPLGSRAFDIVEMLVRSGGELVTKDALMTRVWSRAVVEENTLQFHISAIRKALGQDRGMLKTVSGRGYRLLGNWTVRPTEPAALEGSDRTAAPNRPLRTNVPIAASALIGRAAAVEQLCELLSAYRVVTLTGPGGIGKTVLSTAVARRLFSSVESDIFFVELAPLSDPSLVSSVVVSALGLQVGGEEVSPASIARAIGSRKVLLVIDNCEHVIEEAARLVETIVRLCPHTSIVTTSREALRIDGEFVYQVPPLDVPSQEEAEHVLEHSAVQLFLERIKLLRSDSPQAGDLPAIASICRHLDGIPLAIEFAAARAAVLGTKQVAGRLGDRFALLTGGRRTALPKHQTLRAALDWSYELLSNPERDLLQRLAVFAGAFSLDAAVAVAGTGGAASTAIADGIINLAAKSLVTAGGAPVVRFRLLETTRAYALERLRESGDFPVIARRLAEYYRALLDRIEDGPGPIQALLGEVRAALDWCFGGDGDTRIGVGLAAAAVPIFLALSLLAECHRWSERAILALDAAARGGRDEMHLQSGLGMSLMFMQGQSDAARAALSKSLGIAETRGHRVDQVRILGLLHIFHMRGADFKAAVSYAKRSSTVARASEDPAAIASAHAQSGAALYLSGELSTARAEFEAALQYRPGKPRIRTRYLGFDHLN